MATTKTAFSTRHPLAAAKRKKLSELLNQHLSDLNDLYSQTKQAHWNVKGDNFIALHKLFDELAESLLPPIDTVAERIVTLGGAAAGTARQTAKASDVEELENAFDQTHLLGELADRFADLSRKGYAAIADCDKLEDPISADILTEVTRGIDVSLYFLETHLQMKSQPS